MAESKDDEAPGSGIDKYLTLDYRTGAIFNRMTGSRVQVVPLLKWRKLKANLNREFRGEAPAIMTVVGATLGSSVAEELMATMSDPEALIRYISDMLGSQGWGVMSAVGDTRYGENLMVSMANCGFCEKEELSYAPQCDFLLAALKGIADTVYGTPHVVTETRCSAMGDSVCLFEVRECENFDALSRCTNSRFCQFAGNCRDVAGAQSRTTPAPTGNQS